MDVSKKPLRGPAEELFDLTIKYVAVWGTAAVIGEGINGLLSELLPRGWRISISLLAVYLFVLIIFWGGSKRPGLRDAFLAWRYLVAILLAIYLGYQWQAYDYGRSPEALISEAARRACAQNLSCKKAAGDYLSDKQIDD